MSAYRRIGGDQSESALSEWGFLIGCRQRLLQTVARESVL